MRQVVKHYSIAFKQAIVAEVESGKYTVFEIARLHEVNTVSVYNWLKKYGGAASQTRIVRIEMPNERNRLRELEKEKRALEKALAHAQVKIMTLEATIEVLEEKSGQKVKKKTDMPLSNESGEKAGS